MEIDVCTLESLAYHNFSLFFFVLIIHKIRYEFPVADIDMRETLSVHTLVVSDSAFVRTSDQKKRKIKINK